MTGDDKTNKIASGPDQKRKLKTEVYRDPCEQLNYKEPLLYTLPLVSKSFHEVS